MSTVPPLLFYIVFDKICALVAVAYAVRCLLRLSLSLSLAVVTGIRAPSGFRVLWCTAERLSGPVQSTTEDPPPKLAEPLRQVPVL